MDFKRRLPALLAVTACSFMLASVYVSAAPKPPQTPAKSYSGYGSMSLKATVAYLFPGVICKFNDVDPASMVSWDVSGASSEAVLNAIAKQINIEWSYQNKVLVFKSLEGNAVAITTNQPIKPVNVTSAAQSNAIPQYVKPETVKDVAVVSTATIATATSSATVKASLKPNEEVVEWVVKSPNKTAVTTDVQVSEFQITSEDETLSLALRRWSTKAGYQLAWEAGKDFSARATTYNSVDVISAIESVMNDTAHSNYPLHACVYDNKVIRVLQVSQGCGRTNKE